MILINDKNFYPTPEHLIEKMLAGCSKEKVKTVLEPSAGSGNISEYVKEWVRYGHDLDIDCIEIDKSLQAMLKGKDFRVVHDDFLTYQTQKKYDLIIMNPPFDNGDKHLLKALQMQENGGSIICLLNAETIKNPYTNIRKDLIKKLSDWSANIEYIQDGFSDAERKTSVEIALIKIFIPAKKFESEIFEKMHKAMEHDEVEVSEEQKNSLIHADFFEFIKSLIHQYHVEIHAGIKLIREYNAMAPHILNSFKKKDDEVDYRRALLELNVNGKNYHLVNDFVRLVRLKYWHFIFDNEKFMGKLTSNLRGDYHNKVSDMADYEFSIYNILALKSDIERNLVKGVEETILKLFEELSNKHHWSNETSNNIHYYNGWKTNKAWKINNKVIIPFYQNNDFGLKYNTYETCRKFSDMSKVFDYLDCGETAYHFNISTELEYWIKNGKTRNIPLKYFDVTFFKKGTCHIKFKNEKLLEKFNLFGSQKKGWLPPNYGKKSYSDMNTEEKEIVKEFSGSVENYNKIYTNQEYYIINEKLLLN
jgi:protein-L-isoaspartate O-methyltransferase